jgi:hypothetical protein
MFEFAQQIGGSAKFSIFTGDVVEGEPYFGYASLTLKPLLKAPCGSSTKGKS